MRTLLLVATTTTLLFSVSCRKSDPKRSAKPAPAPVSDGADDDDEAVADDDDADLVINFTDDVAPLMKTLKCASCHGAGATSPTLVSYANYKASAVKVLSALKDGSMPKDAKSKVTAAQIKVVSDWIADGKLERTATNPSPKAAVVSYDGWTKSFLEISCMNCHGANGTSPNLSTFVTAKAAGKGSYAAMIDSAAKTRMPKNAAAIPAAKLAKFKVWVDAGMPQSDKDAAKVDGAVDNGAVGATVTYDGDVKQWVSSNCLECHNNGGTQPILASKAQVVAKADAMLDAIKTTMPKGNAPMKKADYTVFAKWVTDGKK